MNNFAAFGLAPTLMRALEKEGYATPTPIQEKAIPFIMEGRDLLGIAQTGTGKTAAFALPVLNQLIANPLPAPRKGCRVLVLSPTRELALQIADSFKALAGNRNLLVATVYGGVSYGAQIRALSRGVDVLVATAGRLVDHLESGCAELSQTEILILDEVDQMLDLGFVKPIRRIVQGMSHRKQSLFFSATMPKETRALANDLLVNPVEVSVAPESTTAERIEQKVLLVEARRKREVLTRLFSDQNIERAIVFTRTKHGADRVSDHLEKAGVTAQAIHGDKSQNQRERTLSAFRAGRIRTLVATDVAARGIDIDGVTHVVNFDLPDVAERYVHRIGRTARAGAEGVAISLCDRSEYGLLRDIERLTKLQIPATDMRLQESIAEDERQKPEQGKAKPAPRSTKERKFSAKRNKPSAAPTAPRTKRPKQAKKPASSAGNQTAHPSQEPLRRKKSA